MDIWTALLMINVVAGVANFMVYLATGRMFNLAVALANFATIMLVGMKLHQLSGLQ